MANEVAGVERAAEERAVADEHRIFVSDTSYNDAVRMRARASCTHPPHELPASSPLAPSLTLKPHLPTLTLNPTVSTLNPQPSPTHPQPSTLNPHPRPSPGTGRALDGQLVPGAEHTYHTRSHTQQPGPLLARREPEPDNGHDGDQHRRSWESKSNFGRGEPADHDNGSRQQLQR